MIRCCVCLVRVPAFPGVNLQTSRIPTKLLVQRSCCELCLVTQKKSLLMAFYSVTFMVPLTSIGSLLGICTSSEKPM